MYASYKKLGNNTGIIDPDLMKHLVEIKSMEQKNQLITVNKVCVIDIFADWCGPCKQIAPQIAQLAKKYNKEGTFVLCKENIENGFTPRASITAVPTFLYFKDNKLVNTTMGCDVMEIEANIQKLLDIE